MTKAYQLIDRRAEWYGGAIGGIPENKHCAWTAIITVYSHDPALRRAMENRLREEVGDQITTWNDSHDWATVYQTMRRLDI